MHNDLIDVARAFTLSGRFIGASEIPNGNINRTYEVTFESDDGQENYIFQKLNTYVFKNPKEVMQNILLVTEHIKRQLAARHENPDRRVLSFLTTADGDPYVEDEKLGFWRAYRFVDNAKTYNLIHDPYYFFQAGKAFGEFQGYLADFPARSLFETIPDFHHTGKRMLRFDASVASDKAGRCTAAKEEIEAIRILGKDAGCIVELLEKGEIPYRVTHNDTKINNILFDLDTDKAICVIDLDTVMPGASAYDFGDAVRSGASTAEEDEEDLDKVSLDLQLFEKFTQGFLEGTAGMLTKREVDILPLGALTMTIELASRFLADYLDGDIYFKTTKPDHNLIRARTQIRLAQDMLQKMDEMDRIIQKYK